MPRNTHCVYSTVSRGSVTQKLYTDRYRNIVILPLDIVCYVVFLVSIRTDIVPTTPTVDVSCYKKQKRILFRISRTLMFHFTIV